MYAIYNSEAEVAELLLNIGADPNRTNIKGQLPLQIATLHRDEKCMAALIKSIERRGMTSSVGRH